MNRLRVVVATTNPEVVGGTESYLRGLFGELPRRGIATAFLTTLPPAGGGLAVAPPDVPRWHFTGRPPASVLADVGRWNADVVYTHGLNDPALDAALAAAFPTVFYAHNYGGMCISGTRCQASPSPVPCRRRFGAACLGLYLPRGCGGRNPVTAVREFARERRRRRTFGSFRAVLAASRHVAGELIRHGVASDRVHLVPLPVSTVPDASPPAPRPFTGRVLFVGRITALKGWSHLLDALPRAAAQLGRPLTLVVAGDGPDRAACEAECRRRGLAAEFLGWVDSARRDAEMRAADLLAVPSVWPEPFGLVGIEAGCVGLPAVGYAVGGIPDWLEPGVSGESAPGDRPDPRELAAAMVRALANADHWQRLRVGAWETAKRFSMDAHINRLIPILEAARS